MIVKSQLRSAVGILAVVVVCGGALALFVKQGNGERGDHPANTSVPVASEQPAGALESEAPIKLGSISVPVVREYFTAGDYRFEDKQLPGNVAQVVGTSRNGQTVLELVGVAGLEQATLRYPLRPGELNGQDMAAIMYLMEHVKAGEADVRWAIDVARKGEPTTRTIGAIVYALQRGPSGTNEFVMRPAPGFE